MLANPASTGHVRMMDKQGEIITAPWGDPLFLDGEAIIIDKPAGLPISQPRRGGASVEGYADLLCFNFRREPQPVHRLDQDTSGCLILARNPKSMKAFGQAFETKAVRKIYVGLLPVGEYAETEGLIDQPIGKSSTEKDGWWMHVDDAGKPARTGWKLLKQNDKAALVAFFPETGRTHQLRVHAAAALSGPLLGDPLYGDGEKSAPRMMLHACFVSLPRGETKPPVQATAPLPSEFTDFGFAQEDVQSCLPS